MDSDRELNVDIEHDLSSLVYLLGLAEASGRPVCFAGTTWLEMVRRPGLAFLELRRPGEVVPEVLMRLICRAVQQVYRPRFVLRSGVAARRVADGYVAYVCWPDGELGLEWKRPLLGSLALATGGMQDHV